MRLILLLACLLLTSCGDNPPPRGSAQDQAAGAAGRADSTTAAADAAGVAAASAQARADQLERLAVATPTEERIRLAAAARVDADVAVAVARELKRQAEEATAAAERAAGLARQEREAEQRAADDRRWRNLCRWLGLVGVVAGAALGGLLTWFASARVGVPVGATIAGLGLLVAAYGQTVAWLPVALLAAVLAGLAAWGLYHLRALRLNLALSRTVDALEGTAATSVMAAKEALGEAVARSGLASQIARKRAQWKAKPS